MDEVVRGSTEGGREECVRMVCAEGGREECVRMVCAVGGREECVLMVYAAGGHQKCALSTYAAGWISTLFLRSADREEGLSALRADRVVACGGCGSRSATQMLCIWADSSPQPAKGCGVERVDIARALLGLQ